VTGSAGSRKPRLHELAGSLDDGVRWPVNHVIQPGEDARRVRIGGPMSRFTSRRGRDAMVCLERAAAPSARGRIRR
jgi:hypothetical protein